MSRVKDFSIPRARQIGRLSSFGHNTKVSVHGSGQVHFAMGARNRQQLVPPQPLGTGEWLHALEIRFLITDGAFLPPAASEQLKPNDKAYLIEAPLGHMLLLNLLVGRDSASAAAPIPLGEHFTQVWSTALADGRPVCLAARVGPITEENAKQAQFVRFELNPKVNFTGKPGPDTYSEAHHFFWGPGGNVLFVIPRGEEAFRYDNDPHPVDIAASPPCIIPIWCPDALVQLTAPDNEVIGTLSITGAKSEINAIKNLEVSGLLGSVTLHIDHSKLRYGAQEKFERPKIPLECLPTIGGVQPKRWDYPVRVRFEGEQIHAEMLGLSVAFRNENLPAPLVGLADNEELLMSGPNPSISFSLGPESAAASVPLQLKFRRRDK